MRDANIEEHSEEAAFLWLLRDRAATSPMFSRAELTALDERVEAHLDGLRIAGARAWPLCKRAIGLDDAGEVFARAELAIETKSWEELAAAIDVSVGDPELGRGLVSALGWAPWEQAEEAIACCGRAARPTSSSWGSAQRCSTGAPSTPWCASRSPWPMRRCAAAPSVLAASSGGAICSRRCW
jgi:uncharacterized protein (TIGR02270 family)